MGNKIIPVQDYEVKSNKTYFFDNNIWISLFAPLINTNQKQQKNASNFLKNIILCDSQIAITGLILSEFSNTYLRFGFDQWKKATDNLSANYKREYKKSENFKEILAEVKILIKKIFALEIVHKYPDSFNAINLENIFDSFEIDFNDSYYYEQCVINNWILVTSDNDFDNLSGNIAIIKI
ncbi:PIN domain-containing protein [Chryseobacterium nematophagum]|uniref:PIN domain-containing protein n=1 Tax=Chryseobacterium nematophagum TaxID=2305228 RepID=A0A3M7LIB4_9FLAO|nr:PIN domain-containing protein [Chryseobacterium nematophagum]RMZ61322.1 PIN domain-containing protein [Chryseobacterium nematophagum]